MEGPEAFLAGLDIELPSIVDPARAARLEPEFRSKVNGQFFWVADAAEKAAFDSNPARYTGQVPDPVLGDWFLPGDDTPRADSAGEVLLFASAATHQRFLDADAKD